MKKGYTIRQLLITFSILCLFIPLVMLLFFVKITYTELTNIKINEFLESKIQQNDMMLENIMSRMVVFSGNIAINQDVLAYLESSAVTSDKLYSNALETVESLLANNFDLPMNVMIFGEEKMLKTWVGTPNVEEFENKIEKELKKYEERNYLVTWFYDKAGIFDFYSSVQSSSFNLLRKIKCEKSGKDYWLIISVDISTLNELIFNKDEARELYVFYIYKNSPIYLHSNNWKISFQTAEKYMKQLDERTGYQIDSSFNAFGLFPTSILAVDARNIKDELTQVNYIFYGILIIILVAFIIILFIFIHYLTKPINKLILAMEETEKSNQYLPLEQNINIREIKVLSTWYNIMINSINEYICQIKEQEYEKRKIYFQMLQMQINPHFLFNTLNSIKWLCYANQDKKAGDLIASLGKMYQISMNKGLTHLNMDEEKEFILSYIRLMENRYDYKVLVEFNMDESVKQVVILKFLLQPIVENSFLHGFNNNGNEKRISIRAWIKENKFFVLVKDNGSGISEEKIRTLRYELEKNERDTNQIGIINVNHRIRLHYGKEYGLSIYNRGDAEMGVEVCLVLPLKFKEVD